MIKSQHRTFGFWFPALLGAFFGFLIVSAISQYQFGHTIIKMELRNDKEYYIQIGLALFGMLLMSALLSLNVKNISINNDNKIISFQNIFTRTVTNYNFTDFDGYIDTFIRHGRGGSSYKVIGLVQGKKVVRRIDSFYYSNFDQLREALSKCNYLGEVRFGFWDKLKMILHYKVLE